MERYCAIQLQQYIVYTVVNEYSSVLQSEVIKKTKLFWKYRTRMAGNVCLLARYS